MPVRDLHQYGQCRYMSAKFRSWHSYVHSSFARLLQNLFLHTYLQRQTTAHDIFWWNGTFAVYSKWKYNENRTCIVKVKKKKGNYIIMARSLKFGVLCNLLSWKDIWYRYISTMLQKMFASCCLFKQLIKNFAKLSANRSGKSSNNFTDSMNKLFSP